MEKKVQKECRNLIKTILALDVGGSSIKSGLVSGETVNDIRSTPINSKGDSKTIIATFTDIINGYTEANHISGIAFSMPGPFDHRKGISYMGPNQGKYEAIFGISLKELLLESLSTKYPITFRDDGESAIVGEALFGAGKPYNRLLGITLGTGIGSSFIINGEPQYEGKGIPENLLYDCLWENKRADEVFSIRGLKSRLSGAGFQGEPKEATELAKTDRNVRMVFELWGEELGLFLNKYVSQFNAQAVIVQGGLTGAFELFGEQIQKNMEARVVRHSLGSKAALLGASDKFRKIHQE